MLGSVLTGLAVAEEFRTEAILVHPVDHPFVRPETVHDIVNALARGAAIAVPIHGGAVDIRWGSPRASGRTCVSRRQAGARAVVLA